MTILGEFQYWTKDFCRKRNLYGFCFFKLVIMLLSSEWMGDGISGRLEVSLKPNKRGLE